MWNRTSKIIQRKITRKKIFKIPPIAPVTTQTFHDSRSAATRCQLKNENETKAAIKTKTETERQWHFKLYFYFVPVTLLCVLSERNSMKKWKIDRKENVIASNRTVNNATKEKERDANKSLIKIVFEKNKN